MRTTARGYRSYPPTTPTTNRSEYRRNPQRTECTKRERGCCRGDPSTLGCYWSCSLHWASRSRRRTSTCTTPLEESRNLLRHCSSSGRWGNCQGAPDRNHCWLLLELQARALSRCPRREPTLVRSVLGWWRRTTARRASKLTSPMEAP